MNLFKKIILFCLVVMVTKSSIGQNNFSGIWESPLNKTFMGIKVQGINGYVFNEQDAIYVSFDSLNNESTFYFGKANYDSKIITITNYYLLMISDDSIYGRQLSDVETFIDTLNIKEFSGEKMKVFNSKELGITSVSYTHKTTLDRNLVAILNRQLSKKANEITLLRQGKSYSLLSDIFAEYLYCFSIFKLSNSFTDIAKHENDFASNPSCIFPYFWNKEDLSSVDKNSISNGNPSEELRCKLLANMVLNPNNKEIISLYESIFKF